VFGVDYSLTLLSDDGHIKTWGLDLEVPSDAENGVTDIVFRAAAPNGKTAMEILELNVLSLKVEDFQITHMVNHFQYAEKFPIAWNDPEVPVQYKAGYYITFAARVNGDPDTVKLRISYSNFI